MKSDVQPVAHWRTKGESTWLAISRSDLESWAGKSTVKRGLTYANAGCVTKLCRTDAGGLLAWVQGTHRYAVLVESSRDGQLQDAVCTCPVGYRCKHAVATIFVGQDRLSHGQPIPVADPGDVRLGRIEQAEGDEDDYDDDDEDEYDEDESYEEDDEDEEGRWLNAVPNRKSGNPLSRVGTVTNELGDVLAAMSRRELVELLLNWAVQRPELAQPLVHGAAPVTGAARTADEAQQVLAAARTELRRVVSARPKRRNRNYSYADVEYDRLRQLFEQLLDMGMANYLLPLGVELLQALVKQVEEVPDEFVAYDAEECLAIVFEAVQQSSLSLSEQTLFFIYALCLDSYDLCRQAAESVEAQSARVDWAEVAGLLTAKVRARPPWKTPHDLAAQRHRRLLDRALDALCRSGQQERCLELLEDQARKHQLFDEAITYCLRNSHYLEAERWILQSLAVVESNQAGTIATRLRQLNEIARKTKNWRRVAAISAESLFRLPSVESFQQLMADAEKANCRAAVRAGALAFVETGRHPGEHTRPAWPLEKLAELQRFRTSGSAPDPWLPLQLAIAENRPDDALAIYDARFAASGKQAPSLRNRIPAGTSESLAGLLAPTHPERAAQLYEELASTAASLAGNDEYARAAGLLKKLRAIRERQGEVTRFVAILNQLRAAHRRKTNLIKALAKLDRPAPSTAPSTAPAKGRLRRQAPNRKPRKK